MERFKNYILIILSLAVGVMGFMLYFRQPDITQTVSSSARKGKVTGANKIVVKPDGEISYFGDSISFDYDFLDFLQKKKTTTTAFLFFNLGYGVQVNPDFLAPSKDIIINVENWSVGATVNLKPYLVSLDYQHINAYPDLIQLKVSIPIF